jgi:hypothetical protein
MNLDARMKVKTDSAMKPNSSRLIPQPRSASGIPYENSTRDRC